MFLKYPSLINHYQAKAINDWIERCPGSNKVPWAVQEKIHGANCSILFLPNAEPKYFSRNQDITNAGFYSADEVFKETISNLNNIQSHVNRTNRNIRLYGELFGAGIQKGVDYGPNKRILFYSLMQNDFHRTLRDMVSFMIMMQAEEYLSDTIKIYPNLEEALQSNHEFDSTLNDKEDNVCEGIVIKPWDDVFETSEGSLFTIKKKNNKFREKEGQRTKREPTTYSEEVQDWHENYLAYIHAERLQSVFSKEGPITDMKDIGNFIPLIIKDAKETFLNEEDFEKETFTKEEIQYIFNCNKEVVTLLKEALGD
jgi:Rnl2 family RNA ligase